MSELPPHPAGGPALPTATDLDPAAGPLPSALEWSAAGRGEPVVLLVDAAEDRAWAADAAVALATGWARAGRRVVLADLHLQDALVHERLGEPNLDGVVDVFLYGASLSRTARPVPGRGFYLISAGTYTEDPDAVLRHARWPRIAAGFADAQATLLLFVPAASAGLASLAEWASAAVLLGEPDAARLPAGLRVHAAAAPPGLAPAPVPAAGPAVPEEIPGEPPAPTAGPDEDATLVQAEEPPPPETEVIPWTDPYQEREDRLLGEYADGIPASTLPAGAVKTREADLRDPPPAMAAERVIVAPKRNWLPALLLVLLGAVVVYAAAYIVNRRDPGFFAWILGGGAARPAADSASAAPAAAAPAPAPAAAGVALPYSVQAKAFASLRAARQMLEGDSARLSGVPLYVSPELVGNVLYYKVMAGTLPDTAQASRLQQQLVYARLVEASDAQEGTGSLVQFTPLAFDLGEFPDRAAARAHADSLLRRQVPAYAVPLPGPGGGERWRVYGGAFRDSVSAEGMRRILSDRRIDARLVERVGTQPTPRE
ncbi:MAG: hypothetical protein ABW277_13830 [Longimicrobiaceae bacterium]